MQKFNRNIIVTVAAFLILAAGIFSTRIVPYFKEAVYLLLFDDAPAVNRISSFIEDIETASSEQLNYSSLCMDIQSMFYRITGCQVIKKDSSTLVRLDNGYLAYSEPQIDSSVLEKWADECSNLNQTAKEAGIPLLYVMAPEKGENEVFPVGTANYIKDNCNRFSSLLQEKGVNILDLREQKKEQNISDVEMFFITDHHWKPTYGIWATNEICQKLQADYEFKYNNSVTDLSNYDIKTYKNWFLGSQGKIVGRNFTESVDDIDLITPKFETSLKVSQPFNNEVCDGDFSKTILNMKAIESCNLYVNRPYSVYKSDLPLQIIENHLANEDSNTIVIIRDSFAAVVTPFLSLTSKEVHVIDLREFSKKRIESVSKYITDVNPDHVIILYTGIAQGDEKKFDFR